MKTWSRFFLLSIVVLLTSVRLGDYGTRAGTAVAATEARVYLPAVSRAFAPGLAPYVSDLPDPANVTAIVDPGDGRLFIGLKEGRVRIVSVDGLLQEEPLLDIRDLVQAWPFEAGLLGLAVHPDFDRNGYFYVFYTDGTRAQIASNLVRYTVGANGLADPASAQLLLRLEQPELIHQGGDLQFGPQDGFLYVAVGDGGTPEDRAGNAQSLQSLMGKILRLDVDGGTPYAIPPDNPFAGDDQKRGEIWALGLRNPWRISFDRQTGDLFIGDVGQNDWEEVNLIPAGSPGGLNFGWPCFEATDKILPKQCSPTMDHTLPIHAYIHKQAQFHCSITGGFVYRGGRMPELQGQYLFADYCAGTLWTLSQEEDETWTARNWGDKGLRWSTFGERSDGELFLGATGGSTVFQIVPDGLVATLPGPSATTR